MHEIPVGPSGSRNRRKPVVANHELFRQRVYHRQLAGVVAFHDLSWVYYTAVRRIVRHESAAVNRWIGTAMRIGSLPGKFLDDAEKLVTRIDRHGPVGRMGNLIRMIVVGIRFVAGKALDSRRLS